MTRYLGAKSGRRRERHLIDLPAPLPTKEQAACCQSRLDVLGRPPIGFCSPECARRRGAEQVDADAHGIDTEPWVFGAP